jgi:enoyl-CoA hydratase/carnithine racemase
VSEEVSLQAVGNDVFEIRLQRPEPMNALGVATCAALEHSVASARIVTAFAERRPARFMEVVQ